MLFRSQKLRKIQKRLTLKLTEKMRSKLENGKPQKISNVNPETEIEHTRFSAGRERYNQRRDRIKRSKNN